MDAQNDKKTFKKAPSMTTYEILSLSGSIIAIVISAVSFIKTRNIAKEQIELERITAELSKMQIQKIEEDRTEKNKPKFNVTWLKNSKSSSWCITNAGKGSAYNVNFELIDCDDSPLITGDIQGKFPHPEIKPNSSVNLNATIRIGSPAKYQAKLSWKDAEDKSHDEIYWVTR